METDLKIQRNTAWFQERSTGTNDKHILNAEQHEFFTCIQIGWS